MGGAARFACLTALLKKEGWAVRDAAGPGILAGGWGGCTSAQAQAAELMFVRDTLGPLRSRTGPVPEKVGRRWVAWWELGSVDCHRKSSLVHAHMHACASRAD